MVSKTSGDAAVQDHIGEIKAAIAHHDGAIGGLSNRMGHVEKTLGDHGAVLHNIERAVTKQDARPTIDFHKMVSTVTTLAVLFSMVVAGIIWVTTSQFMPLSSTVQSQAESIKALQDKLAWSSRIDPAGRK